MSDRPVILGTAQTRPVTMAPPGSCDCHTHVFGPAADYPFDPKRTYTPGDASIEDLLALHALLGIERVVIVHPSPYGTDNRCSVDAVRRMGDRARGVAVIGESTTDAALQDMHAAGMRGVRCNLHTVGNADPDAAWETLVWAANRVAPLGWHVQVYTDLALIAALRERLPELPTTLVIDHFGRAMAADGPQQKGFDALLTLLDTGRVYVKMSAPHRISHQPGYADAAPIARALIAANPDRLVWATDWPHPGARPGKPRSIAEIEPFHGEDDGAALDRLAGWAGDADTLKRILVDNPARLYDFGPVAA
jgi:predicted TIM-barrel fold metal-dependent hydrolase